MVEDYTAEMDSMTAQVVEHDFAQLEHINQIIYDNREFKGWECFDTSELLKAYPSYGTYNSDNPSKSKITKNVVDVRYNSMIVNIDVTQENMYIYTFEIRNTLWSGVYKITHSKNSSEDEDVLFPDNTVDITSPDETNILRVVVNGNDDSIKDIRVCFEMNMDGEIRKIDQTALFIDSAEKVSHQFDESFNYTGYVYDQLGNPSPNTTVTIRPCDKSGFELEEGIPKASAETNSNGNFVITVGAVPVPGTYYMLLTAKRNTISVTYKITVERTQGNTISMLWGDDSEYDVYKGRIKTYTLQFKVLDSKGKDITSSVASLKDTPVTVTAKYRDSSKTIDSVTGVIDSNGEYKARISYRGMYEVKTDLLVNVPATTIYSEFSSQREVIHHWYIAHTFIDHSRAKNDIVLEAKDEDGTDFIMIPAGTYQVTDTIPVNRDLTFCGMTGKNRVLLEGMTDIDENGNGDRHTICSITDNDASKEHQIKVKFYGIAFVDSNYAIKINTGCDVLVDNCYFHHNGTQESYFNGVSIHQVTTDETHEVNYLFYLTVRNSTFYNNVGTEIMSIGETEIYNNLFRTGNLNMEKENNDGYLYLKQPAAKVVAVHKGDVTYKNNKSFINASTQKFDSNNTVSKALCRIWTGGRFNGKAPNVLHENDTLPVFGDPWNNEAFTYAIYYYPNDKYQSELVCSPAVGNERRATGHRAEGVHWTFWDGYYFVRWNNGKNLGNVDAVKKWSEGDLELPGNQGVYDEDEDKFVDDSYNPLVTKVVN